MATVCNPLAGDLLDYKASWTAFADLLGDVAAALAKLESDTVWTIVGASGAAIGEVTLQDYLHKFQNISWTLTDKDYGALNGGVGEVLSRFDGKTWLSAAEEIRAPDFDVYMRWPDREGATYLALHETAHTTDLGLQLNTVLYDQFIHTGGRPDGYASSPQWLYNEASANLIARNVATSIGFPILPQPTAGYAPILRNREIA